MGIFDSITHAKKALDYGEQLAKPATWKLRQSRLTVVAGFLNAVLFFIPHLSGVDGDITMRIATGVDGVWGLLNWYFINSTSAKVGFK
jgi:hypothetical protein